MKKKDSLFDADQSKEQKVMGTFVFIFLYLSGTKTYQTVNLNPTDVPNVLPLILMLLGFKKITFNLVLDK